MSSEINQTAEERQAVWTHGSHFGLEAGSHTRREADRLTAELRDLFDRRANAQARASR